MTEIAYLPKRLEWEKGSGPGKTDFEPDLAIQRHPILGFHLRGDCPNCGHKTIGICPISDVSLPVTEATTTSGPGMATMPVSATSITASSPGVWPFSLVTSRFAQRTTVCVMTCRCVEGHPLPAAPAGTGDIEDEAPEAPGPSGFGCGASWLVEVKYKLFSQKIISVLPVDASEQFKSGKPPEWQRAQRPKR